MRLIELRQFECPVGVARCTRTDDVEHLTGGQVRHQDPMVIGVGDEEPSTRLIRQHLARERENRIRDGVLLQHQSQRGAVESARRVEFLDYRVDHRLKDAVDAFA